MTEYTYNGFRPYGAGELFILDEICFQDTIADAIASGCEWVENGTKAVLKCNGYCIDFVKEAQ